MSALPDLQSRVREITGVASANVRWPDPHGPATLHLEFAADADPERVGRQLLAALRDVGDVDLGTLTVEPAAPAAAAPRRPVFSELALHQTHADLRVEVTMVADGGSLLGVAEGVVGARDVLIAEATLSAVASRSAQALAVRDVSRLEVGGRRLVSVLVDSDRDWQATLSGSSLVEHDERVAIVRATLDAVNRLLIEHEPPLS